MISSENIAANVSTSDTDFTIEHYRKLLKLATANWEVVQYDAIPWGSRYVLWRHDIDYSLNRSLALARIEKEESVRATYFLNPHSEFYNLAELGQHRILQQILSLGHNIGLHFDAAFYDIASEAELDRLVALEASNLEQLFGVKPVAFSFHNPMATHLACEVEQYGGLLNCYSKRFKNEVAYCSDSNGYWRFRRLHDVLSGASDPCLQVLTHPGWWQDKPMPSRQRIFRSAYGRANATMRLYDESLQEHGRLNHTGASAALRFLELLQPDRFELCDYLWNRECFLTLFVELWRLHESQISRLCQAYLRMSWHIPAAEVNAFFGELSIDGWKLFNALFDHQWTSAAGVAEAEYKTWAQTHNLLIHGRTSVGNIELEAGCVYLCQLLQTLAEWGLSQPIRYDGLVHLSSIGLPTCKTEDGSPTDRLEEAADEIPNFPQKRWQQFKAEMKKVDGDGTAE